MPCKTGLAVFCCLCLTFAGVYGINGADYILVADGTRYVVMNPANISDFVIANINVSTNMVAIDFDKLSRRVYFSDVDLNFIASAKIFDTDARIEAIISNSAIEGIAIDSDNRLLFYTDYYNDEIVRVNIDNFLDNETIVSSNNHNISDARAIVIDSINRLIYWSDWGKGTIEKATYEGLEREVIVSTGLSLPNALAIDFTDRFMYIGDAGVASIFACNIDGTDLTRLVNISGTHIYGASLYRDSIVYTSRWTGELFEFHSVTNTNRRLASGFVSPFEVKVTSDQFKDCPQLSIANGLTNVTNSNFGTIVGVTCNADFILSGNNTVRCEEYAEWSTIPVCLKEYIDIAGTDYMLVADRERYILTTPNNVSNYEIIGVPQTVNLVAIDFDQNSRRVYFSDVELKFIASTKLFGMDFRIEAYIQDSVIDGIAIDSVNRFLFYTDAFNDEIVRVNIDNFADNETIIHFSTHNISNARAIVLDRLNRYIYWSDWGEGTIERSTYDGLNKEILIQSVNMVWPNALAINYTDGTMYIGDAGLAYIFVANLSALIKNVSISGTHVYGAAIYQEFLAITSWSGEILLLNTATDSIERPITGLIRPSEIKIVSDRFKGPSLGSQCGITDGCQIENSACVSGICQCLDEFFATSSSTCEKQEIYESCHRSSQCNVTNGHCWTAYCMCYPGYYQASNTTCERRLLGEACTVPLDCNVTNSECTSGVCQCKQEFFQTSNNTCEKRDLGDSCNRTSQCVAADAECIETCVCKSGYFAMDGSCYANNSIPLNGQCPEHEDVLSRQSVYCSDANARCLRISPTAHTCQCPHGIIKGLDVCMPLCQQIEITNGTTIYPGYYNDVVSVTCEYGFRLNGSLNVTCGLDGLWTPLPTCDIIVCGQTNVSNGNTIGTGHYNDSASIECDIGFLNGSDTVSCGYDGQWYPTPTCEPIVCPQTYISNGSSINLGYYNDSAEITCDTGFSINGSDTVTCGIDGAWYPFPTCQRIECNRISISNGSSLNNGFYNDSANVTCDSGFRLNGSETVTCGLNEQWSPLPTCERIECPALSIPNASISTANTTIGTVVDVFCNSDFVISGSNSIACLENGRWSTVPECIRYATLSSPCNTTEECNFENSVCTTGMCWCQNDFYPFSSRICKKQQITEPCERSSQCNVTNGHCWNGDCLCYHGYYQTSNTACERRLLGELCSVSLDCNVTNSECTSSVCRCQEEFFQTSNSTCEKRELYYSCNRTSQCVANNSECVETCRCMPGYFAMDGSCYANNSIQLLGRCPGPEDVLNSPTVFCSDPNARCLRISRYSYACQCFNGKINELDVCMSFCQGMHIANGTLYSGNYNDTASVMCEYGFRLNGSYHATCGLDGKWSSLPTCDIIECNETRISNGSTINSGFFNETANFTCDTGFRLNRTDTVTCGLDGQWSPLPTCEPIDDCVNHQCENGATCEDQVNTYTCICPTGFEGTYCETNIDECQTNDCQNNATCVDLVNSYRCTCLDGYDGELCENDINDCVNNSCVNGICVDMVSGYVCSCDNGYSGQFCSVNDDDCASNPCQSNATCIDGVGSYTCTCAQGYTGGVCETDIDECQTNNCQNNATCVDLVNSYICTCLDGYDGELCENDVDECASSPCNNAGTCADGINSYTCACVTGYTDIHCETNIDECASNPCENGGTCTDEVNGFLCACADGFTGTTCRADCGALSVNHGTLNTSDTTYGTVVMAECEMGYYNSTQTVSVCQGTGDWSILPVCSIIDCGSLNVSNGHTNSSKTTYMTVAEVTCDTGYETGSFSVAECQLDATWSASLQCFAVECPSLSAPVNGSVAYPNGKAYGSSAVFTCSNNLKLSENATVVCGADRQWQGQIPECKPKGELGANCTQDSDCRTSNSRCLGDTCACSTVYDARTDKCDTMYLFPYGTDFGDQVLEAADDVCSGAIVFTPAIPVFDKSFTSLYVCSNGLVSFGKEHKTPSPPKNAVSLANKNILAPFYVDTDTATSGSVFYRSYDILNTYNKINSSEVEKLANIIETYGNIDLFSVAFVLIVTWEKVTPFQQTFTSHRESTFQLILATDGSETFSLYVYGNSLMQWDTQNAQADVLIGYSFGTSKQYLHPFSYTKFGLHMDVNAVTNGIKGLLLRRLTDVTPKEENYGVKCLTWYHENIYRNQSIYEAHNRMPECPCDVRSLYADPWWWNSWIVTGHKVCMEISPSNDFGHYGKTCCYNWQRQLWIYDIPRAGGVQIYHRSNDSRGHEAFDTLPKEWCCEKSNFCQYYYDLHPIGTCYLSSRYSQGLSWGDPHFRTLDRKDFTFNGRGEYTLLTMNTDNGTFDIQARTERLVKADGNLSYATIFTAFAAIETATGAHMHVELNEAKDGLNIYANKKDVTNDMKTAGHSNISFSNRGTGKEKSLANLQFRKNGKAFTVLFTHIDVALTISASAEMLSLTLKVPEIYRGKTKGLLGNYDRNASNDFISPNGTIFPGNMGENETFHFCQLWEIDGTRSAFVYRNGTNHTDFHDHNYVPKFLDEADKDLIANATKACRNDSTNIACIFDFVFADENVAGNTDQEGENEEADSEELSQTTPELSGCDGRLMVTIGEQVSCPLIVSDEEGLTFGIEYAGNVTGVNASVTKSTASPMLFFEIRDDDPVTIRVAATNPKNNKTSPAITVDLLVCTLCSGHGECIEEPREDSKSREYFKYARCNCRPQYTGQDCEDVLDGCLTEPCAEGQPCENLTVEKQIELNASHVCGDCPQGYNSSILNRDKCADINECTDGQPCQQICINTEGSYDCSCSHGYRIDTRDFRKCKDINECNEGIDNCSQVCINTDGGYNCSCYAGYDYNYIDNLCYPNNETICAEKINCTGTSGCTVDNDGNPQCFCEGGYEVEYSGNVTRCKDINECDDKVCPQGCKNTNGGFECTCLNGFYLSDKTTCTECEQFYWGEKCANTCNCSDVGTLECDKGRGCVCKPGWTGDTCHNDINECGNEAEPLCVGSWEVCINTMGSYTCGCQKGFLHSSNGKCEDDDECSNSLRHNCSQLCNNTIGSYACDCSEGYYKKDQWDCADIDECKSGIHNCEHICENTVGSYQCYCTVGWRVKDDRRSCSKMEDPCKEISSLQCDDYCEIRNEQPFCVCSNGFRLGKDNQSCFDINECRENKHTCNGPGVTCENTDGSYRCKCPDGTKLENDKRTCSSCDAFHYGTNCSQECVCDNGYCDPVTGCKCFDGWTGDSCNFDIDECRSDTGCKIDNTTCVNLPGTYEYRCCSGYRNDTGQCKDIDECKDSVSAVCDQICSNTVGGYECSCESGFLFQNGKCQDIDECLRLSNCAQECDNTIGSYRCSCRKGFYLDLNDRESCIAVGQCAEENQTICLKKNATCVTDKSLTNYKCVCATGFYMNTTEQCEDINECEVGNPCMSKCENRVGGFGCSCENGQYLLQDGISCSDCQPGFYGINCENKCACIIANTASCDRVYGNCTCTPGWEGENCTVDINECDGNPCVNHSTCDNIDGSFTCTCDVGFIATTNKDCEPCTDSRYGKDCSIQCECNVTNTLSCNNENGSCLCRDGWTGQTCNDNVDECQQTISICASKNNSECVDTLGSYQCVCKGGFDELDGHCQDIPECSKGIDNCTQECRNTFGGFECSCHAGYYGNWNNCTECEPFTYGKNCTQTCECDRNNTVSCNRATGVCTCKDAWNGARCTESIFGCHMMDACKNVTNSKCVDVPEGYICECLRGFTMTSDVCTEVNTTPTISPNTENVEMTLTIEIVVPNNTDFSLQTTFDHYANKARRSLYKLFEDYTEFNFTIIILNLRLGSLVIDYEVVYPKSVSTFRDVLTEVTYDLAQGKTIDFDGQNVSVTTDELADRCSIYENMYGKCAANTKCEEENGSAVCKPIASKDNFYTYLGIGLGAAFGALTIVFIVLCIYLMRKRRQSKKIDRRAQYEADDRPFGHVPPPGVLASSMQSNSSRMSHHHSAWPVRGSYAQENRYTTWRSMMWGFTDKSLRESVGPTEGFKRPFNIPRVEISDIRPKILGGDEVEFMSSE